MTLETVVHKELDLFLQNLQLVLYNKCFAILEKKVNERAHFKTSGVNIGLGSNMYYSQNFSSERVMKI